MRSGVAYIDAIAPGITPLQVLNKGTPAIVALRASEKCQHVRGLMKAEEDNWIAGHKCVASVTLPYLVGDECIARSWLSLNCNESPIVSTRKLPFCALTFSLRRVRFQHCATSNGSIIINHCRAKHARLISDLRDSMANVVCSQCSRSSSSGFACY